MLVRKYWFLKEFLLRGRVEFAKVNYASIGYSGSSSYPS